ncbi:CBL-interacting serine/threonine-protein kinase 4-like [Silene latifolia]|uniref:CBL-interacting serine/threonine-protein kinase 4-like n=1 Tax=Silene latifolia TaxID=37657 RepID=UPI003D780965
MAAAAASAADDATAIQPPPPPPDPTSPKTVLGRYQLGRVLGRGSFAKVYYARSLSDHKSVAIKVIDKLKTNPSIHPKIIGEVAAMRRLDHPNILRIHEVMATKHKIYLVMELAKGGDLFAKLTRRPDHRFPEPLARRYFHQLVSALNYCHRNGVAHRDVKPQNLLLDDQANIKIADFGLSAIVQTPLNDSVHLLKTACGTPAFAAPEIVGRAGYDGSKADVWSCGVILFVLLSGYLPFDDGNLVVMYRRMCKKEYRFPSWVSKSARGLITRLLDPNPNTRLSIEGIMEDSWLKNQGMVYPRSVSLGDMASLEENKTSSMASTSTSMNAFEIISMSSGLDLSGFFGSGGDYFKGKREKRFTSRESKGVVVDKVAETGLKLGYEVERRGEKGFGSVWLGKGRLVLSVAVIEVADEVVLVEVRVVDGGGVGWDQEELHWGELKIGLADIVVSWHDE